MTLSPSDARNTVIDNDRDLRSFWSALMGRGGFAKRSLWLAFFDHDGRPTPVLLPIDDIPKSPDRSVDQFAQLITGLAEDGSMGSVAMLLSRPGPGGPTGADRRWAAALRGACADVAMKVWPVHLATENRIACLDV